MGWSEEQHLAYVTSHPPSPASTESPPPSPQLFHYSQHVELKQVNPGSKAAQRGVREGDVISSINSNTTRGLANGEAHSLLRSAGQALLLGLNQDASPKRRSHKQQQQQNSSSSLSSSTQQTPEHESSRRTEPCSTATATIVTGCAATLSAPNCSTPSAAPPLGPSVAAVNASASSQPSNQQQSKSGTSSPKRTSANSATNPNPSTHESSKSHRISSGGGRQKRNRRIKARKKALQVLTTVCEYENISLEEPQWEIINEIAPLPTAVHASPLLSAEALYLSDDIEPRPDIPTVEELKKLLSIHLRVDDTPKRKPKLKRRAETFPPSLRRLEVIAEEEDAYEEVLIDQSKTAFDEVDDIYEDVDIEGANGSVFRAEQCYIYSDSDDECEQCEQCGNEAEYELLPCRVIHVLSDEELSEKSIESEESPSVEIIELIAEAEGEITAQNNCISGEGITPLIKLKPNDDMEDISTLNEVLNQINVHDDLSITEVNDLTPVLRSEEDVICSEAGRYLAKEMLIDMHSCQYEENYENLIEEGTLSVRTDSQSDSLYDDNADSSDQRTDNEETQLAHGGMPKCNQDFSNHSGKSVHNVVSTSKESYNNIPTDNNKENITSQTRKIKIQAHDSTQDNEGSKSQQNQEISNCSNTNNYYVQTRDLDLKDLSTNVSFNVLELEHEKNIAKEDLTVETNILASITHNSIIPTRQSNSFGQEYVDCEVPRISQLVEATLLGGKSLIEQHATQCEELTTSGVLKNHCAIEKKDNLTECSSVKIRESPSNLPDNTFQFLQSGPQTNDSLDENNKYTEKIKTILNCEEGEKNKAINTQQQLNLELQNFFIFKYHRENSIPVENSAAIEINTQNQTLEAPNELLTSEPLKSISFVANKLAHILEVTDQAVEIFSQKIPENVSTINDIGSNSNDFQYYDTEDTQSNKFIAKLQHAEKGNLLDHEFSLSEKSDSTYQLRQFLKSIRDDSVSSIEEQTSNHSRSESLDSNCSLNTTVYCDVKSNNSSLSSYLNNFNSGTQPKSLRQLCLELVAQFPNGLKLMLDWGLATVEELDLRIQPKLNLEFALPPAPCSTTRRPPSLPATSHGEGCSRRGGGHGGHECWCWLPIPACGPYVVCLSPSQQRALPQHVSPEKAAALLDLHYKVSQRRAYYEPAAVAVDSEKMGLNEEQQEQRLKATILSDWLALARSDQQQQLQSREKSPLTRFEKLDEESSFSSVMTTSRKFEAERYHISKQRDIAVEIQEQKPFIVQKDQLQQQNYENNIESSISYSGPVTENDVFREQMFSEYQQQMAERAERRQNKILRVSEAGSSGHARVVVVPGASSAPESAQLEVLEEFASRARKRMEKLGIREEEVSTPGQYDSQPVYAGVGPEAPREGFVLEGGATQLPKRIQEDSQLLLADNDGNSSIPVLAPTFKATAPKPGVWSPKPGRAASASASATSSLPTAAPTTPNNSDEPPPPPVWTPKASPTLERKEFRPVRFEATTPPPRSSTDFAPVQVSPPFDINSIEPSPPVRDKASSTISSSLDRKLTLNIPRLPRAQNPTVTLLQKAREGQLPRGALYLDHKMSYKESEASGSKPSIGPDDVVYSVKREGVHEDKRTVELAPKKYDGIGPTTKEGIPIVLRSGIKEENYGKWYKRMYDSLHKAGRDDDHITIRYRPNRRGYPYSAAGGYASEPEPVGGYDSDIGYSAKYATLDRRRIKNKESDFTTSTMPRSKYLAPSVKYACEVYKNQPGRIEDYEPGHSSISDKEAKLWWDEVMDIFDGHSEGQSSSGKPFMTYALKESGYESDSQLVFKRREESAGNGLSPTEHKQAYKSIQSGGEVPLHGLRKPAPERPKDPLVLPSYYQEFDSGKESPHKFVECGEVTIHYRSPVRGLARDAALSEEELARRQEEAMRRIYQEERRRKYLQELHDMESRRHTDNFTPSQKSPIPLNRYDDFFEEVPSGRGRDRTPEPKMVARALYNFVGQSPRELTFRRGDIIIVRRQIDKNWYEGEHNASIGLFPFNYVEIIPYDGVRTFPKGPTEGKARAKFNFTAQTHLELSLVKGENVVLTRRVDDNWYEGRIGARKGIFPVSYVEVIQEPGERLAPISPKPVASPASHSLLLNGSASTHHSGPSSRPHQYNPYSPPNHYNLTGRSILAAPGTKQLAPVNQTLHIDTHSEPVPYRALYNYKPQNDDELELREGDTVFVMEKCDDGWYVGSSHRSGHFGTFPGNYVERV